MLFFLTGSAPCLKLLPAAREGFCEAFLTSKATPAANDKPLTALVSQFAERLAIFDVQRDGRGGAHSANFSSRAAAASRRSSCSAEGGLRLLPWQAQGFCHSRQALCPSGRRSATRASERSQRASVWPDPG